MRPLILAIFSLMFLASSAFAEVKDSELALKQNQTYNFATSQWAEKIRLSGLLMGELIASDHDAGAPQRFREGKNKKYSTFCFPRASLYLDAKISDWTQAHIALNLAPAKISKSCSACGFGRKNDELRFGKYDKIDESYVTFSNMAQSPYYARAGIQYVPYGYYARNTIPATLPQLMTQIQAAGITAGYANNDNGMSAAIFSFSGKNNKGGSTKIDNFGAQAGYIKSTEYGDSVATLGWINNIASSVNYIVSSNPMACCGGEQNPLSKGFRKKVAAMSLTLRHEALNWDATLQFTSALSKFHQDDIEWKNKGARPSAGLLDLGYKFGAFGERKNRIGASYQLSHQAVNLRGNYCSGGLPKQRLQVDYTIEAEKHVELGAHVFWDKDYSKKDDGTSRKGTTGLLTLVVKLG